MLFRSVSQSRYLRYQGEFPASEFPRLGLPGEMFRPETLEFYGKVNLLKGAILLAHEVTTVSPSYAREIQTEAFGHGLHEVLKSRAAHLSGILNGIDEDSWNPESDGELKKNFSSAKPQGREECRAALEKEMGLEPANGRPIFGMVTRLAEDKGVDLALGTAKELVKKGGRLVAYRDWVRHSITQLADYHFVATKNSRDRVIQMGRPAKTIYYTGCPSIDILCRTNLDLSNKRPIKTLGSGASVDWDKPFLLVVQHPVTTSYGSGRRQILETLYAVAGFPEYQKVVLWPNADAGSDDVSKGIREFKEKNRQLKFSYFKNFSPEDYARLLKKNSLLCRKLIFIHSRRLLSWQTSRFNRG